MRYNHFLFNPKAHLNSFSSNDNLSQINIINQTFTGIRSDIQEFYGDAYFNLAKRHQIGIKIYNLRLTSLFTRSKAHLSYSIKIPINENIRWSTGAQLGLVNVFLGSSSVTSGGSDWDLDGSISTCLEIKSWQLGVGLHQFTNPSLTPISFEFSLLRYGEFIAMKKTEIAPKWQLTNGLIAAFSKENFAINFDNRLEFDQKMGLLLALEPFNSSSLSVGADYKIVSFNDGGIRMNVAYRVPLKQSTATTGQYLIGLGFTF